MVLITSRDLEKINVLNSIYYFLVNYFHLTIFLFGFIRANCDRFDVCKQINELVIDFILHVLYKKNKRYIIILQCGKNVSVQNEFSTITESFYFTR